MEEVSTWLSQTAGVCGSDHEELLQSFQSHGITSMKVLASVPPADWRLVTGKIGLRFTLVAAIDSDVPKREVEALNRSCDTLMTALAVSKSRNVNSQQELDSLKQREALLSDSIAHQRVLLQNAQADPARARFADLETQVAEARAACDAARLELDREKQLLASALAEKDAVVMRAVNAGKTNIALQTLEIPSLSPSPTRKDKDKEKQKAAAGMDRWADLSKAPWYVGKVDRDECVRRLLLPGCGVGYFCIRDGSANSNPYSLSFRGVGDGPASVRHMRITKDPVTGKFKLAKRRLDNFETDSLSDLVGYYLNMDVGEGITLSEPAPKPKAAPKSRALQPHEVEAEAAAAAAAAAASK